MAVVVYGRHEHLGVPSAVEPEGDIIGSSPCRFKSGGSPGHEMPEIQILFSPLTDHHDLF